MPEKAKPMICPECGATMNHHGEKLVEPRNAEEARLVDARLGGVVQEIHACPECGRAASRPAL